MTKSDGLYAELASGLRALAAVHRALAACYEPDTHVADDHSHSAEACERTCAYWERAALRFSGHLLPPEIPPAAAAGAGASPSGRVSTIVAAAMMAAPEVAHG